MNTLRRSNAVSTTIAVILGLLLLCICTGRAETIPVKLRYDPPLVTIRGIPVADFGYAPMKMAQDPPTTGSEWSAAWYYDVPSRESSGVVMHPLTTFQNIFGHPKWSLDLDGFVGATLRTKTPVMGVSINKKAQLASNLYATAGVGIMLQQSEPVGWGITASLGIRF